MKSQVLLDLQALEMLFSGIGLFLTIFGLSYAKLS